MFFREHVKSLRQQCSWLDQKESVIFRAESKFFRIDAENQLFLELIQYCSEFIRVYSTEQNNVSGSISGIIPKAMPSSSSILIHCVLDVFDLDVIPE